MKKFRGECADTISKNVDFSLCGKQCIVLPNYRFFRVLAHCTLPAHSLQFPVCLHFSDDLNVDEEPPPAPPTAVVDDGLEKELEKLNEDEVG